VDAQVRQGAAAALHEIEEPGFARAADIVESGLDCMYGA
jgi:hypothetical protein